MCGIAGFIGIHDPKLSYRLLWHLGLGIDNRGGQAVGHVTVNGRVTTGHTLGQWRFAGQKFRSRAAGGHNVLMHSRFATCSPGHVLSHAHPFTIRRAGKAVLHGVHNGMIYNAEDSAEYHDRSYNVDSRELLELVADGDWKDIRKLRGYGTIAYVRPDDPEATYVGRLSHTGELYICSGKDYAVFASTEDIALSACWNVGLSPDYEWKTEPGKIYRLLLARDGLMSNVQQKGVKLNSSASYYKSKRLPVVPDEPMYAGTDGSYFTADDYFKKDDDASDSEEFRKWLKDIAAMNARDYTRT